MTQLPITESGYQELKKRLDVLRKEFESLPQIIAHARAKGDLKENAEYHAAKERQGMLNAEMNKINSDLQTSRIIDPKALPTDTITFGKTVELKNTDDGSETSFTLLGPAETQIHPHAVQPISVTSVIAKSILGKKLNAQVKVVTPAGEKNYLITGIFPLS